MADDQPQVRKFNEKQGQYLAFIYAYTHAIGRPPAEADFQRKFQVTAPSVHQMIVNLEKLKLIQRTPGTPRSIRVTVPAEQLPILK